MYNMYTEKSYMCVKIEELKKTARFIDVVGVTV